MLLPDRTLFSDFKIFIKVLFSEWPIVKCLYQNENTSFNTGLDPQDLLQLFLQVDIWVWVS